MTLPQGKDMLLPKNNAVRTALLISDTRSLAGENPC